MNEWCLTLVVRHHRQIISLFLLIVLGTLSLKVLFSGQISHGNCDEFAHVHFRKVHSKLQEKEHVIVISDQEKNDADRCHEGKSISANSAFPALAYDFTVPKYELSFDLEFKVHSNYRRPYLEPFRKPPKNV